MTDWVRRHPILSGVLAFFAVAVLIGALSDDAAPAGSTALPPAPAMSPDQSAFFQYFSDACARYESAPNEIQKSAIFNETRQALGKQPRVDGWLGTVNRIATNKGGAEVDLIIGIGKSEVQARNVPRGSPIYEAAATFMEGQQAFFSSGTLRDANLTERGAVCDPYFSATLTVLEHAW